RQNNEKTGSFSFKRRETLCITSLQAIRINEINYYSTTLILRDYKRLRKNRRDAEYAEEEEEENLTMMKRSKLWL
ncbi:MAG: hypothetical protein AAGG00_17355, partial [Cyanobacteria bacterium P01_H01_bin.150]